MNEPLGPVVENGTKVTGKLTYSDKVIEGKYMYVFGPDYDWTGKASKNHSEVHFIVDEHGINLPVEPFTIKECLHVQELERLGSVKSY